MSTLQFDCPRCRQSTDAEFYGPCPSCRTQLRESMGNEARVIETADYEPKMNVVPNQVATKD